MRLSAAFKNVKATDASIILSAEPIFAALFAMSFLDEAIDDSTILGGSLIIFACLLNELGDKIPFFKKTN